MKPYICICMYIYIYIYIAILAYVSLLWESLLYIQTYETIYTYIHIYIYSEICIWFTPLRIIIIHSNIWNHIYIYIIAIYAHVLLLWESHITYDTHKFANPYGSVCVCVCLYVYTHTHRNIRTCAQICPTSSCCIASRASSAKKRKESRPSKEACTRRARVLPRQAGWHHWPWSLQVRGAFLCFFFKERMVSCMLCEYE